MRLKGFVTLKIKSVAGLKKSLIGFTLIELIVVIAIIAILAAIIAPNAFMAIEKAKVAKCISDMRAVRSAAMAYYADVGEWPAGMLDGQGRNTNVQNNAFTNNPYLPGSIWVNPAKASLWDGPYLEKWPEYTPWNTDFHYLPAQVSGFDWNGDGKWDSYIALQAPIPADSARKMDIILDGEANGDAGTFVHEGPGDWPTSGTTTTWSSWIFHPQHKI